MILRAVKQGQCGLGVGRDTAALDQVWIGEEVDPAEITFDYETYLLLLERAEVEKARLRGSAVRVEPTIGKGITDGGPEPSGEDASGGSPPGGTTIEGEQEKSDEPILLEWHGSLPKDKWNLLSHNILARLGKQENVTIDVTIRTQTEEPSMRQQLNTALRELGLEGEFTVPRRDKQGVE